MVLNAENKKLLGMLQWRGSGPFTHSPNLHRLSLHLPSCQDAAQEGDWRGVKFTFLCLDFQTVFQGGVAACCRHGLCVLLETRKSECHLNIWKENVHIVPKHIVLWGLENCRGQRALLKIWNVPGLLWMQFSIYPPIWCEKYGKHFEGWGRASLKCCSADCHRLIAGGRRR